ncbi:MAG: PIN domain-containing protein [Candidatus Diapherotrites archaeon]
MRLYMDSNVLISILRSEMDRAFNMRFQEAEDFISFCRALGFEIVVSDLFAYEIKKAISLEREDIGEFFRMSGVSFVWAAVPEKNRVLKISRDCGIHFADAAHVSAAVAAGCDAIITWDKKDFSRARAIMPCFTPAEFVQRNP